MGCRYSERRHDNNLGCGERGCGVGKLQGDGFCEGSFLKTTLGSR